MSLSLNASFGSAGSGWAKTENGSAGSISLSVTCGTVGDLVVIQGTTTSSDIPTVVTDSNSKITWDASAIVSVSSDGNGFGTYMWKGTITSTGVTSITPNGGGHWDVYGCEINSTISSPTWAAVTSNSNDSSGATATWPSLTSDSASDQGYIGGLLLCNNGSAGSTSGFSYLKFGSGNVVTWNVSLSTNTAYQPTCSSGGGVWDTIGVIVSASASGTTASAGLANVTVAANQPTPKVTVFPGVANITVAANNPSVTAGGNVNASPGKSNVTVTAYNPTVTITAGGSPPTLPSDATVGTPAWRMICWGGPGFTDWTLQAQVTNETNYGFYGFEATDFSGTPSSSYVSLMNTGGVESYFGLHWVTTTTAASQGTLAGQVLAAGGTGMGWDTEQAVWADLTNSQAQTLGQNTAEAIWGAFPGCILLWYHYFPPGGWNDVYENGGVPHTPYQQDYLFLGMLQGMNSVGATGRIVLMDASFYRDAFWWEPSANNQAAYFLNSQGSRAQLSNFFDQTTWNYAVDHFDIAGFTWRGTDNTTFYNDTEGQGAAGDTEWVQSITDARSYSEGSRRAEYLFNDELPPTPYIPAGTSTFTYTSGTMLAGSQAEASQTALSTSVPTLTAINASLSGGTVTITCNASHAYGVRYVKVYNGNSFNPANPVTSYLGAMTMTFNANGGSYTTNYNNAYEACTFTTSAVNDQWFVLEATSIKDDIHWADVQAVGSGPTGVSPGTANVAIAALAPTVALTSAAGLGGVTVAANNPTINITAKAGLAAVTVAAPAPSGSASINLSTNVEVAAFNPTVAIVAKAGVANVTVAAEGAVIGNPKVVLMSAAISDQRWSAVLHDGRWEATVGNQRWDAQVNSEPRWKTEIIENA